MTRLTYGDVNPKDFEECAREAIHINQLIQPHGFLIAINADSAEIAFVSENAASFFGMTPSELLDTRISDLLEAPQLCLQQLMSTKAISPISIDVRFNRCPANRKKLETLVHRAEHLIVIEVTPFPETDQYVEELQELETIVQGIGEMHRQKELVKFLDVCADEIRKLSGYRRVIIYRFLPDWSGEVIAESASSGLSQEFMGLRFPASDIPEQARELYKKNLLRVIGDVGVAPIPIVSRDPALRLDQTHSILRSPSPIHLAYLSNMQVRSTMTISLMRNGELWGMVACHHDAPRIPPVQLRRMTKLLCALVSETVVLRLDELVRQQTTSKSVSLAKALSNMVISLNAGDDFDAAIARETKALAQALRVDDVGLFIDGRWICNPSVEEPTLLKLIQKTDDLQLESAYFTQELRLGTPSDTDFENVWPGLGIVRLPFSAHAYLFLLRKEAQKKVLWAGAPTKERILLSSGEYALGPRRSFGQWSEIVKGKSEPWLEEEIELCVQMAKTLDESYIKFTAQKMQTELRMLGSCMQRLNDMVLVTETDANDLPGPRILYANDAFLNHTGFSKEDVTGKSPRILQGEKTDRMTLDRVRKAMEEWRPITVELINYKKSGDPYWVEISMAPIADETKRFTHWVSIQRDIESRKRVEMDIQKLVFYDALTGLPNRRLLMDRLRVALSSSRRYSRNGAVIFVDLDNFKDLNDTEGHHVGDELLKQVARRLSAEVRLEDTVARLGGDEFVVVLEGLSSEVNDAASAAQIIAEKLIHSLSRPYELPGKNYTGSASIGISLFQDHNTIQSLDDSLKYADFAMYEAKSAGRNTWRFYDPLTQAAQVARNLLAEELNATFHSGGLSIHYQPIVDHTRVPVGVEALLRWQHPTKGWISPVEFIGIAEQNGLIVPIGNWVLKSACELLSRWSLSASRKGWTIAVNVSARQLQQRDFVETVRSMVDTSGCDASRLKLELTESLLQHDFESTVKKMDYLKAQGIQFSIDDFGTGYSSLTYLRKLPISVLKIDRSFVQDAVDDPSDQAICKTILALGQTLNLKVIAEGVETESQFALLQSNGCENFQGYLFSRPITVERLEETYPD